MEKATNTLNVLDVEIKMNDTEYDTRMWRKPTNTGLLLNFFSICPTTWKCGLMKGFLHRVKYTGLAKKNCTLRQSAITFFA